MIELRDELKANFVHHQRREGKRRMNEFDGSSASEICCMMMDVEEEKESKIKL